MGEDVLTNTGLNTVSYDVIQSLAREEREGGLQFSRGFRKIVECRATNRSQDCFGLGGAYGGREGCRRVQDEFLADLSGLDQHQGVLSGKYSGGNV